MEPAVLYSSVDESFVRQIVRQYEQESGRQVLLVSDSEAGKTTGLVKRIRLERDRPRADVFWSSEQSQTVLLARDGLLAPYASPSGSDIPGEHRDPHGRWTGFALRARVIAFDPAVTNLSDAPTTWAALADPSFAKHTAIANPLFGTTRGHFAAMHALWGGEEYRAFLKKLVDGGAVIVDGNSTAVRKLLAGQVRFAATDSDDVFVARRCGHNIEMLFPDMGDGGTMLIPNTVALIAGGAHPAQARQLIDYILSPQVEEMLARSDSGNYPVRASLREKLGIELPPGSRVDYNDLATSMPQSVKLSREIFLK